MWFYFQRFTENCNVSVCMNDLLMLEHEDVQSRIRTHAAQALLTAVENASDAIELTSEDHEIQVSNTQTIP